jgi:hypothetical protein
MTDVIEWGWIGWGEAGKRTGKEDPPERIQRWTVSN